MNNFVQESLKDSQATKLKFNKVNRKELWRMANNLRLRKPTARTRNLAHNEKPKLLRLQASQPRQVFSQGCQALSFSQIGLLLQSLQ
jgi:hypothetical protein